MSRVTPFRLAFSLGAIVLCVGSIQAQQQQGRGRGGAGGFGGFNPSPSQEKLGYLRNEAVQKELELADDQKADLTKISEAARAAREAGGGGFNREEFAKLSEEDRRKQFAEMQTKAEAATKETWKKVEAVLLPHQLDRLQEIYVQARGVDVLLNDAEIGKTLAITEKQKEGLTTLRDESRRAFGQGGGGFDAAKMAAARKEREDKSLALLNATQKEQFAKMKGEPFAEAASLRFGGGGRPGEGGRPQGGQGGQPRTRPSGNNNNNN